MIEISLTPIFSRNVLYLTTNVLDKNVIIGFSTKIAINELGKLERFDVGLKNENHISHKLRLCKALDISCETLKYCIQTHSSDVVIVDCKEQKAECRMQSVKKDEVGSRKYEVGSESYLIPRTSYLNITHHASMPYADALVTDILNVPLMITTADCVPILLYDKIKKTIAAIHAGWRGCFNGIIEKTILSLKETFGVIPASLNAIIGPAIGPCCYEIGEEFQDKVKNLDPSVAKLSILLHSGSKLFLDLRKLVNTILEKEGILSEHIFCSMLCTKCNSHFLHSYRKDGEMCGSMGSIIMLKEN